MNTGNSAMFYAMVAGGLVLTSCLAIAQDLYVYPAQGQSDQQLADDRYACHRWAVTESGFDPSRVSDVAPPRTVKVPVAENAAEGAATKGAVAGAVAGGIIGAHGHDAAEGAVLGAAVGTLAGAVIEEQGRADAREKAEAEAQRQADEIARSKTERALRFSDYRRALTACLEGKGYTVR